MIRYLAESQTPHLMEAVDEAVWAEILAQAALDEAVSPFADGTIITKGDHYSPINYEVRNDGWQITITRSDAEHFSYRYLPGQTEFYDLSDSLIVYTVFMINNFPKVADLFDIVTNSRNQVTAVSFPTFAQMSAFQRTIFMGLPVAGVRLIQSTSNKNGDTDVLPFADKFHRRLFAASQEASTYTHDAKIHWLGSASLHEKSWEGFRELFAKRELIVGTDPAALHNFVVGLGDGIDFSTGTILNNEFPKVWTEKRIASYYLLSCCMSQILWRCSREEFQRCVAILDDIGLGATELVERNDLKHAVVQWEFENLADHYEQVYDRLGIADRY